jgi:hypothetical protein
MNRSAARSIRRLIGGSAPKSATPPNFNRPEQIAMVVRQLASAIGRQSSERRSSGNAIQCSQHAHMLRVGVGAPQQTHLRKSPSSSPASSRIGN